MKATVWPAALALFALLVFAIPVRAGLDWSDRDPVVSLDGTRVQILVAIPEKYLPLANGPIKVDVHTPTDVAREVVYQDAGFNGHGEFVRFADRGDSALRDGIKSYRVRIRVMVPIDRSGLSAREVVPVRVTVVPANDDPIVVEGVGGRTEVELLVPAGP